MPRQSRGQADFGHQHNGLPPGRDRGFHRPKIDLGLAGSGHAEKQERCEFPGRKRGIHARQRPDLGCREMCWRRRGGQLPALRLAPPHLLETSHYTLADQFPNHARAAFDCRNQFGLENRSAHILEPVEHPALRRGPATALPPFLVRHVGQDDPTDQRAPI